MYKLFNLIQFLFFFCLISDHKWWAEKSLEWLDLADGVGLVITLATVHQIVFPPETSAVLSSSSVRLFIRVLRPNHVHRSVAGDPTPTRLQEKVTREGYEGRLRGKVSWKVTREDNKKVERLKVARCYERKLQEIKRESYKRL